jgi:hypothetical protein
LAGEVIAREGQLATGQLEEGIGAPGIGVVLIFVAAGHLEHALANQVFGSNRIYG